MTYTLRTVASAIAVMMVIGGASAAFAKAHDQGVADGTQPNPAIFANTGEFIQTALPGPGDSAGNKDGTRGGISSGLQGDNAVVPVVDNGQH